MLSPTLYVLVSSYESLETVVVETGWALVYITLLVITSVSAADSGPRRRWHSTHSIVRPGPRCDNDTWRDAISSVLVSRLCCASALSVCGCHPLLGYHAACAQQPKLVWSRDQCLRCCEILGNNMVIVYQEDPFIVGFKLYTTSRGRTYNRQWMVYVTYF